MTNNKQFFALCTLLFLTFSSFSFAKIDAENLNTVYEDYQVGDEVDELEELDAWIIPFRAPKCKERSYSRINGIKATGLVNINDEYLKLSLITSYAACAPDEKSPRGFVLKYRKIGSRFQTSVTYGMFHRSGAYISKMKKQERTRDGMRANIELYFDTQKIFKKLEKKQIIKFWYTFTPVRRTSFHWYIIFKQAPNGELSASVKKM